MVTQCKNAKVGGGKTRLQKKNGSCLCIYNGSISWRDQSYEQKQASWRMYMVRVTKQPALAMHVETARLDLVPCRVLNLPCKQRRQSTHPFARKRQAQRDWTGCRHLRLPPDAGPAAGRWKPGCSTWHDCLLHDSFCHSYGSNYHSQRKPSERPGAPPTTTIRKVVTTLLAAKSRRLKHVHK